MSKLKRWAVVRGEKKASVVSAAPEQEVRGVAP